MKRFLYFLAIFASPTLMAQNVGIGTATPVFKLDVRNGSINTDSVYRIGSSTVLSVKGTDNSFVGIGSGFSNTLGNNNSAFGDSALFSNTWGTFNTASGVNALYSNINGWANTASGSNSLYSNIDGIWNTAFGVSALYSNTYGNSNTASGWESLYSNTLGELNTANGMRALYFNTEGNYNAANGSQALFSNRTGNNNTANGFNALFYNSTGNNNTANGFNALFYNSTGNNNTAIGYLAGLDGSNAITTGSYNTFIGVNTGFASPTQRSNATAIGYNAKVDASNAMVLGGTGVDAVNVGIGTTTPGFPLNFALALGDKISLFGNTGNTYGFGIQNNLLQIHAAAVGEDVAFGYGSSASFTETMRIKGNGKVGIGITTPNAPLAFTNTTGPKISLYEGSANSQYGFAVQSGQLQLYTDVVTSKISFGYYTSGLYTERMYLTNNTGILTVAGTNYPSDARYKKQITRLQDPLKKIMAMNGVQYFMRTDEFPLKHFDDKLQVGLIAQEVEKILPQVVQTGDDGFKAIDYAKIVPLLVEGIKEQQKQIDELRKLVEKLLKQ